MLTIFFTAVYFFIFFQLVDLIFRHTLSPATNIVAIICWVVALIASGGLAEYTVKKIKEKYRK